MSPFRLSDGVEDESCYQREARQEDKSDRKDGGGEARDKACLEIFNDDGDSEGEADDRQYEGDKAEELERTVVLEERADHHDDLNAVTYGVKFGFRSRRSIAVSDRHVEDAPATVDGVD